MRRECWFFLNTTSQDVRTHFEYEARPSEHSRSTVDYEGNGTLSPVVHRRFDRSPNISPSMSIINSGLEMFQTTSNDPHLLSHYEAVVCKSSTLLDDTVNNPYRHVMLPMAMQSQVMYHAILAISAQILNISNSSYSVAALEHGILAMKGLSAGIRKPHLTIDQVKELLALTLVLCWLDITNSCRSSWVTHLSGMHMLLRQYKSMIRQASCEKDAFCRFLDRYFAFHLVLARTTFRINDYSSTARQLDASTKINDTQLFRPDDGSSRLPDMLSTCTEDLSLNMSFEALHEIDPYMGFSNALLLLINEIAELARNGELPTNGPDMDKSDTFDARFDRLQQSLEFLVQTTPSYLTSDVNRLAGNSIEIHRERKFKAIAEAYRFGALLLLHTVRRAQSRRTEIPRQYNPTLHEADDDDLGDHSLVPSPDEQCYVRSILNLIDTEFSLIYDTAALPLWPLFLAGCSVQDDASRITVLSIFERLETLQRFGNISPARQVVELVWRQRDLGVQDDRKRRRAAASTIERQSLGQDAQLKRSSLSSPKLERFVWEPAMTMLGGVKLSLT